MQAAWIEGLVGVNPVEVRVLSAALFFASDVIPAATLDAKVGNTESHRRTCVRALADAMLPHRPAMTISS